MDKVPLRELRVYRKLFDRAAEARDYDQLAAVAAKADRRIEHWLLLGTMKDKLLERAIALGIPCRRTPDKCFAYLIRSPTTQRELIRDPVYVDPPRAAQAIAKHGLAIRKRARPSSRPEDEPGMVRGTARAREIIAGSPVEAGQIKAFFDQHEHAYVVDLDRQIHPKDSPTIQAWMLWGGDPMRRAAESALSKARGD